MNIMICVLNFSWCGGVERIVSILANLLIAKGINTTILSLYSSRDDRCAYELDDRVKVLHMNVRFGRKYLLANAFKIIFTIRKFVRENKIDFFVGTFWLLNLFAFLSCSRCRIIAWEHGNYDTKKSYSKFISNCFFAFLSSVCCLTKNDAKHYKKGHLISNCNTFEIDNSPYRIDSKKIIALGRLSYEKGFDSLLQVAALVKKKHPDWKLEIYGDGKERDNLQRQIAQLELHDFVTMNPAVTDVRNVLRSSSFYVMSSRFEGFGLVLTEAQCFGLPLIAFDCPSGPREIITNNKNGYLIPPGNIEEFAEKINFLIENPQIRLKMSKESRKNAANYTPDVFATKWIGLFNSLK